LGFEVVDNDAPIAAFTLDDSEFMAHVQGELLERGIAIQHTRYPGVCGQRGTLRQ